MTSRTLTLIIALLAGFAGYALGAFVGSSDAIAATPAAHRSYLPRAHHACRVDYRREVVKVRERHHGKLVKVRQVRCVYHAPTKAAPVALAPVPTTPTPSPSPTPSAPVTSTPSTPAPTVSYSATVDPSFTQAPNDPLLVTYAYSADAVQTVGAVKTDLAGADELPDGILNFYSPTLPGRPAGLICSIEVGGALSASQCPVDYQSTGTYEVTTQYIPNGLSAVTQTDTETIAPFTTSTSEQVQSLPGQITVSPTVLDQNGNPLDTPVQISVYDERNGETLPVTGSGTLTLTLNTHLAPNDYLTGAFPGYAFEEQLPVQAGDTLQITSQYLGGSSYNGSASSTALVTVAS